MIVTTPSGYKVTLKDFLSFGDKRKLLNQFLSETSISMSDQKNPKISDLKGNIFTKYQDFAFGLLVTQIEKDGKVLTENLYEEVMGWREEDGDFIYKEVTKIANLKEVEKKIKTRPV